MLTWSNHADKAVKERGLTRQLFEAIVRDPASEVVSGSDPLDPSVLVYQSLQEGLLYRSAVNSRPGPL